MKLGTDPEIFIFDGVGSLIPARRALGTDQPISYSWGDFAVKGQVYYPDGLALEASTEPVECCQKLVLQVEKWLSAASRALAPKGYSLGIKNTLDISAPRDAGFFDFDELQLGCKPSQNAYHEIPPELDFGIPIRSTGGHIHLGMCNGYPPKNDYTEPALDALTLVLDEYLGVLAVCLAQEVDSPERRRYYGRAGEYRRASYGMEYRTLSNFWLGSPVTMQLVFDLAKRIPDYWRSGLANAHDPSLIQAVINACDIKAAQAILRENWSFYKELWEKIYLSGEAHSAFQAKTPEEQKRWLALLQETCLRGPAAILPKPWAILDNWKPWQVGHVIHGSGTCLGVASTIGELVSHG